MSADAVDAFFAGDPAISDQPAGGQAPRRMLKLLALLEQHQARDLDLLLCLAGVTLLMAMVAPERQRLGAERILVTPVPSFLAGVAPLLALALAVAALLSSGVMIGRQLLGAMAFFALATGLAVSARALGARALPDHPGIAQTALGLVALILPLAWPLGLLTTVVAAPLGLGAWLLARRR